MWNPKNLERGVGEGATLGIGRPMVKMKAGGILRVEVQAFGGNGGGGASPKEEYS